MVFQCVRRGVCSAKRLDIKLLEQGARRERGLGQRRDEVVIDAARALAGQLFRDAEQAREFVMQPQPRGCATKEREVVGKGLPDLRARPSPRAAVRRATPSDSSGTPWL